MTPQTEKIAEEALKLPREARAFVAERLLESLDHEEEFAVSDEWLVEIRRRCREVDSGAVALIAADDVFAEVEKELG